MANGLNTAQVVSPRLTRANTTEGHTSKLKKEIEDAEDQLREKDDVIQDLKDQLLKAAAAQQAQATAQHQDRKARARGKKEKQKQREELVSQIVNAVDKKKSGSITVSQMEAAVSRASLSKEQLRVVVEKATSATFIENQPKQVIAPSPNVDCEKLRQSIYDREDVHRLAALKVSESQYDLLKNVILDNHDKKRKKHKRSPSPSSSDDSSSSDSSDSSSSDDERKSKKKKKHKKKKKLHKNKKKRSK